MSADESGMVHPLCSKKAMERAAIDHVGVVSCLQNSYQVKVLCAAWLPNVFKQSRLECNFYWCTVHIKQSSHTPKQVVACVSPYQCITPVRRSKGNNGNTQLHNLKSINHMVVYAYTIAGVWNCTLLPQIVQATEGMQAL